jgi:hypothetical protein
MANEKITDMVSASTFNDADVFPLVQSGANKKGAWSLFKSVLKTYFDTLYSTIASQPRSIFMDAGDQSTTSNVATDITELVFSVSANKRYFVRGHIRVGCNNTGGVKIAATVPASATFYNALTGRSATTTPATVAIGVINSSGSLSTPTFIVANNAFGFIEIAGEFTIGATAGNVQFQFASGTNTQTSTVYQQGTQISVIELS